MKSWNRLTVSTRLFVAMTLGASLVLGALGMGYAHLQHGEKLLSQITQAEYQHMQEVNAWQLVATGTTVRIMAVGADPNLSHRADRILSQGWRPVLR